MPAHIPGKGHQGTLRYHPTKTLNRGETLQFSQAWNYGPSPWLPETYLRLHGNVLVEERHPLGL